MKAIMTGHPMINCRSISDAAWEQARSSLVIFFSRRCGFDNAEDLAQATLTAVWQREDFFFSEEKDFPLVCYGFARMVLREGYRDLRKAASAVDVQTALELPDIVRGMSQAEMSVLLEEVKEIGKTQLTPHEWRLIDLGSQADRGAIAAILQLRDANTVGVQLYRARKKLAQLVGWNRNDR